MTVTEPTNASRCQTRYFGTLEYEENSVLVFPEGIPAFERQTRFLAIRQPVNEPLVFLQSLADPNLCFAALPAQVACPGFRLRISPEDLSALDLDSRRQPVIGRDVLCLAILSLEESGPPTV